MITTQKNWSIILSEVDFILKQCNNEMINKIPQNVLNKIESNKDSQYYLEYDITQNLNNQKISEEAKDLISALFLQYVMDENTKKELVDICKNNDILYNEDLQKKYSYDSLFPNKEHNINSINDNISNSELSLTIQKNNWFSKLITIIKNFFKI